MTDFALVIRPVGPDNFDDLATLFEGRGGPDSCWCMVWRAKPKAATEGPPIARKAARKAAMQAIVSDGVPVGMLAYRGITPVGWCAVGPRESLRSIGGPDAAPGTVWTITCFFVASAQRGQGISAALLQAAISLARDRGAQIIEASPVDPSSPSYRFMGFVSQFLTAGFTETGMSGTRRHLMRLTL
jgi:GNAT superfamily N-acetyltransferase